MRLVPLLCALATTTTSMDVSRAREGLVAYAKAGPIFINSAVRARRLESRARAVEAAGQRPPEWPRDADLLCGRWELVATTRGGADLLQTVRDQPALGSANVYQDWSREGDEVRCDNVITIGRPNAGLLSAWTLLAPGTSSSLRLRHAAAVVSAREPLTIDLELDGVVVDGSRPGEDVQTIFSLPMPRSAAGEAGLFETTFLDDALRIARAGDALRVFERVVDT